MSIITKASAKLYYLTGSFPTQNQFADTIDTYLGLGEAGAQTVQGAINFKSGIQVSANSNFINGVQVSGNQIQNAAYKKLGTVIVDDGSGNLTIGAGQVTSSMLASGNSRVTTLSVVTDSTDISLSNVPTQTNVGSTFSMTIPTNGLIWFNFAGEVIIGTAAAALVLGLRIGTTNYWPVSSPSGTPTYSATMGANGVGTFVMSSLGMFGGQAASSGIGNAGGNGTQPTGIPIEASGIPTGAQTVQVIAGLMTVSSGTITLKGTVVTTCVYITVEDHT